MIYTQISALRPPGLAFSLKSLSVISSLLFASFIPAVAQANLFQQLTDWDSFGFFSSVDDDTSAGDFRQTELYLIRDLPWKGVTQSGLTYEASLFAGGGWYKQAGDTLEYATVGPVVRLGTEGRPLKLELGIRPGILFDWDSPGQDFGGTFTFFDHAGLLWQPTSSVTLGYRFQHMSNGSFYPTNPGINMHLADIRVTF